MTCRQDEPGQSCSCCLISRLFFNSIRHSRNYRRRTRIYGSRTISRKAVLAIDAESGKPTPFYPPLYPLLSPLSRSWMRNSLRQWFVSDKDFSVRSSIFAQYEQRFMFSLRWGAHINDHLVCGIVIFRSPAIAILVLFMGTVDSVSTLVCF